MLTITQIYSDDPNAFGRQAKHVYSARKYFVQPLPPERVVGRPDGMQPGMVVNPMITAELSDGHEEAISVIGEVFVTNEAGKTIDVIRPWMIPGKADESRAPQ